MTDFHGVRLHGAPTAVAPRVDRLLLRCDVAGIEEREGWTDVWLQPDQTLPPDLVAGPTELLRAPAGAGWDHRAGDRALEIEPGLVVRPPWVPPRGGFRGIELVVPRGMAFGTGEHESTQLALRVARQLLTRPCRVADVGTGSGILALLATRLGCEPVVACDVDLAAVRAARDLVPSARVYRGGPEALAAQEFDCVLANLSADELAACLPALAAASRHGGTLLLSGIRHREWPSFAPRLPDRPFASLEGDGFRAVAVRAP